MLNQRLFHLSIALAAFVLGAPQLSGQAMVSYGHGVAKAGVAGSALGAGAAGLFRGTNRPLEKAQRSSSYRGRAAQSRPRERENVKWDLGDPTTGASSLRLAGGVRAAGVDAGSWTPALVQPRENVTVLGAEWSDGTEEVVAEDAVDVTAPQSDSAQGAARGEALVVVADRRGRARGSGGDTLARADSNAPLAAVATLPVETGMSLEEVLDKLGKPKFSFVNVAGYGFNDQFVFELEDGRRIVVYALDGLVSHVHLAG